MDAYSSDLRSLILQAVESGQKGTSICEQFAVHRNTVHKYIRQSLALLPTREDTQHALRTLDLDQKIRIAEFNELSSDAGQAARLKFPFVFTKFKSSNCLKKEECTSFLQGKFVIEDAAKRKLHAQRHTEGFVAHDKTNKRWIVVSRVWVPETLISASQFQSMTIDAIRVYLCIGCQMLPAVAVQNKGGVPRSDMVKMTRQHKINLAQVLHSSSLTLESAAEYIRTHVDSSFPITDASTLSRAAKSMHLSLKKPDRFDPKQVRNTARQLESDAFLRELGHPRSALRGEN
eukprot:7354575-Prymnesium_polylepis.1